MKKQIVIALFILLGISLALISIISHKDQVINLGDTYYVINSFDFGLALLILFFIPAVLSFICQKFVLRIFLLLQLIFFSLPVIYFMIYDEITQPFNPGYYYAHPILSKVQEIYLPLGFLFMFIISVILLLSNLIYSMLKQFQHSAST